MWLLFFRDLKSILHEKFALNLQAKEELAYHLFCRKSSCSKPFDVVRISALVVSTTFSPRMTLKSLEKLFKISNSVNSRSSLSFLNLMLA